MRSLILAALLLLALPAPAAAWTPGTALYAQERLMISLVNEARAQHHAPAVTELAVLRTVARVRAKDMGDRDYMGHWTPEGVFGLDFLPCCFEAAAEAIGMSRYIADTKATAYAFGVLMRSSSHHAALMGHYHRIGVGSYKALDGRFLYVIFLTR